ncbi:MAG: hypothetical protein EOO92_05045 [Pedobacter sp.]|nr:MAG: hypothetical protein EOO92_05045 [Pedobacter sp.]
MKIKDYIESGILEAYVMGSTSQAETQQLLEIKEKHPEVADALNDLELDLERIAQHMAIVPPPGMLGKIQDSIGDLVVEQQRNRIPQVKLDRENDHHNFNSNGKAENQFIEVEGNSAHMRIHKAWRWVFAAVFVLGKVFLGFAIYYYLENRQLLKQVNKMEAQQEILQQR